MATVTFKGSPVNTSGNLPEKGTQAPDFKLVGSGLNEISWWVLGYGAEAEVVQPPELREILKKHIARMSEIYKI